MSRYTLELMDDSLHNPIALIEFLQANQHKDIVLEVNQESHCLHHTKVYDLLDQFAFSSVTLLTANAVEYHPTYQIKHPYPWYHWLTRWQAFDQTYNYSWNGDKIFGCFYGRPSASRLGFVAYLEGQHAHTALIKLVWPVEDEVLRLNFELQKIYSWDPEIISDVVDVLKNYSYYQSNLHAYDYETFEYDFSNPLHYEYKNIFVDLVVEATAEGNSFYPTEKIARAILCRKPFIVMASPHYLTYLRQMGFETFNDCWDESYDLYGGRNRYLQITKLLNFFGRAPLQELWNLNSRVEEIVEHNYQLLISQKFNTEIMRVDG